MSAKDLQTNTIFSASAWINSLIVSVWTTPENDFMSVALVDSLFASTAYLHTQKSTLIKSTNMSTILLSCLKRKSTGDVMFKPLIASRKNSKKTLKLSPHIDATFVTLTPALNAT